MGRGHGAAVRSPVGRRGLSVHNAEAGQPCCGLGTPEASVGAAGPVVHLPVSGAVVQEGHRPSLVLSGQTVKDTTARAPSLQDGGAGREAGWGSEASGCLHWAVVC